MSTFRSLRSRPSSRLRHVASHAALLGLAVAALVGTTGCATCCRQCPPPCPPPCGGGAQPVPMPPPLPPPSPPAPKPQAQEKEIAALKGAPPTIEACRPFLAPPGTQSMPDVVVTAEVGPTKSQLDKGGFVLWQVQGGMWQRVGWAFKAPAGDTEHWFYRPNFAFASCAAGDAPGTAWTMAIQCFNPNLVDLPEFMQSMKTMNGGSFEGITYKMHAVIDGPPFPP